MRKPIAFLLTVFMILTLVTVACTPSVPAPVEDAPVAEAPVEEAPVEEAPVEEAPVEEPTEEVVLVEEPEEEMMSKTILPEPTVVSWHTDWFYSTDQAAFWSADFHGFFEERNIIVEVHEGGPGIRPANDVALGNIDFALALAENIILAEAAGGEFLAFFATFQNSLLGLMVHEEAGIESLEDLVNPENDMFVSMFPGQVFWEVLKFENNIVIEEVAHDGSVTAFTVEPNRAQQAMATTNPYFVKEAAPDVNVAFLSANDLGFETYTHVYFTNRNFAEENPLVVRAFAEALQEGLEAFFEDPESVSQHIHDVREDFSVDVGMAAVEVMRRHCFSETTDTYGLGAMDGEVWSSLASRMYAAGIIEVEVDTDLIWTNDFLLSQ